MRFLYLDDSGKIHANHPSRAVVFAGLSVGHGQWHAVVRQVNGAKGRYMPGRGHPGRWELKGSELLSTNGWNRRAHRDLCFELADILLRNDCRVYSVGFVKRNSRKRLSETWAIPLCFQAITAKFACELDSRGSGGAMVCDWTSYAQDHDISQCVQAYVLSRGLLRLAGGATFGSSQSLALIQVADVIAYTMRTTIEGAIHHADFARALRGLLWVEAGRLDIEGFPVRSEGKLF